MKAACLVAAASASVLLATPALAVGESGVAQVLPASEAWYPTANALCSVPVFCGSAPTTVSYPDKTLHVGVQAGQEAARTYLAFGPTTHPTGTTVDSALLKLPVANDAGTNGVVNALLQACLVPGGLSSPAPTTAPKADCTVSSHAAYVTDGGGSFQVDLAPLLAKHSGELNDLALAIVPQTDLAVAAAVPSSYHVAFSGKDRHVAGAQPIRAEVAYSGAGSDAAAPTAPIAPEAEPPVVEGPIIPNIPGNALPLSPAQVAAVIAPQVPVVQAPAPVTRAVPRAFTIKGKQYGLVWALPLVLFGLGWLLSTTAKRDLRSYVRPA